MVPAATLELVDRFVQSLNESAMATAAYAVFDTYTSTRPVRDRRTPAAARDLGVGRAGARRDAGAPAGGVSLRPLPRARAFARDAARCCCSTPTVWSSGVASPLSAGIEVLASCRARRRDRPRRHVCSRSADLVPLEGLRDDVAIVALQNGAVPAELHLTLPAEPKTLAQVRRILRRWLIEHGADEGDVAEMTIAVSEACANAIEHAYSPVSGHVRAARVGAGRRASRSTVRDGGQLARAAGPEPRSGSVDHRRRDG